MPWPCCYLYLVVGRSVLPRVQVANNTGRTVSQLLFAGHRLDVLLCPGGTGSHWFQLQKQGTVSFQFLTWLKQLSTTILNKYNLDFHRSCVHNACLNTQRCQCLAVMIFLYISWVPLSLYRLFSSSYFLYFQFLLLYYFVALSCHSKLQLCLVAVVTLQILQCCLFFFLTMSASRVFRVSVWSLRWQQRRR